MAAILKIRQIPNRPLISFVVGLLFLGLIGWMAVEWMVNRVYVKPGWSVRLRYKGSILFGTNVPAKPGHYAQKLPNGTWETGILEQMGGPGRHFYCPLWWERRYVEDVVVEPGQLALFTSKLGQELPPGEFLVDGELGQTKFKGILRKVYGPGRYRVNDYAYGHEILEGEVVTKDGNQIKRAGWVNIPTGYVGVVTNRTDNPITKAKSGVQDDVFPPGLYPVNPKEQQIDIVEIGLREKSVVIEKKRDAAGRLVVDASGEPIVSKTSKGISFPSNDGFTIFMDFTAIWGLMPDQAPQAVRKFGNIEAVENKVVVPQIESICRNQGSKLGAVELLEGDSRQEFQKKTSDAFRSALSEKDVTLQYGLVRYIHIPNEVRVPIQKRYLSDELKLTADQKQITAGAEAVLREEEQKVELSSETVRVESDKLVAKRIAEGEKRAREIGAEAVQLIAAIDKKTALLEAQATVLLGEARAQAEKMLREAKSEKFVLAVAAFGSGEAYNQWVFASGLPEDLQLNMLYAGEGTFWTDLKGFTATMLGKQLQQQRPRQRKPSTP